ncbi:hypothetical protein F5884DRAFT_82038 [Xylogone sp. PMI_703]|nr:hypothetical protein F5884DRAFT_82038 [Xylogone sp. PMI_703]
MEPWCQHSRITCAFNLVFMLLDSQDKAKTSLYRIDIADLGPCQSCSTLQAMDPGEGGVIRYALLARGSSYVDLCELCYRNIVFRACWPRTGPALAPIEVFVARAAVCRAAHEEASHRSIGTGCSGFGDASALCAGARLETSREFYCSDLPVETPLAPSQSHVAIGPRRTPYALICADALFAIVPTWCGVRSHADGTAQFRRTHAVSRSILCSENPAVVLSTVD